MRTSAGIFVFNPDGNVLVCEPSGASAKYGWTIPKGHVEKGEDPLRAAKRETYEESNINIDSLNGYLESTGTGIYKNRKKQLITFAFYSIDDIDAMTLKCHTVTKHGWPEVRNHRFVKPETAISILHHVQSEILRRIKTI